MNTSQIECEPQVERTVRRTCEVTVKARRSAASVAVSSASQTATMSLLECYRSVGGVATGDEVAEMLRAHCDQPISRLARWMVAHRIVSFRWSSFVYIPLFQFDPSNMSLRSGVSDVVAELSGVMSDQEIARWFVTVLQERASSTKPVGIDSPALLSSARLTCALIRRGSR